MVISQRGAEPKTRYVPALPAVCLSTHTGYRRRPGGGCCSPTLTKAPTLAMIRGPSGCRLKPASRDMASRRSLTLILTRLSALRRLCVFLRRRQPERGEEFFCFSFTRSLRLSDGSTPLSIMARPSHLFSWSQQLRKEMPARWGMYFTVNPSFCIKASIILPTGESKAMGSPPLLAISIFTMAAQIWRSDFKGI